MYFLLGGACLLVVGVIFVVTRTAVGEPPVTVSPAENLTDEHEFAPVVSGYVVVHVAGEVHSPGVFTLDAGARVNDALYLAGGATAYADLTRVNLAAVLSDEMQIIIPAEGEELPQAAARSGITADGRVNINHATAAELQTLSGIGQVRAQSIIDFRETHGSFASVDELIHISGIGATTLENLRPHVTVD
jgi:competence protein ComEA